MPIYQLNKNIMDTPIKEIIWATEERELLKEFREMINTENCTYEDIEDLMLGYGLEMDYFEQLLF